jgi:hypothetical protein
MISRDKGDLLYFLNDGTKGWPEYLRQAANKLRERVWQLFGARSYRYGTIILLMMLTI